MQIENHIKNLKKYIKDDEIIEKDGSDFANFCKGHIDDIQAVLNELEKKDKIINVMARMINNHDIDDDICSQMGKNKKCNDYFISDESCINCIKEYFINKVEVTNENRNKI